MFEINGVVWQIVLVSPNHPALTQPNGRQAIGACVPEEQRIYISAATAYTSLYTQVLCHEIAHAAVFSYGIDLPLDEEEFLASFISLYGQEILDIVNRFS